MNILFINDYENIFSNYSKNYDNMNHIFDLNIDIQNYDKIISYNNDLLNIDNIIITNNKNLYYKNNNDKTSIFFIIEEIDIIDLIINDLLTNNIYNINQDNKYLIYKKDIVNIINNYINNEEFKYAKLIEIYNELFMKIRYNKHINSKNINNKIYLNLNNLFKNDLENIDNKYVFKQDLNFLNLNNVSNILMENIKLFINEDYFKKTYSEKYLFIKNNYLLKFIYDIIYNNY